LDPAEAEAAGPAGAPVADPRPSDGGPLRRLWRRPLGWHAAALALILLALLPLMSPGSAFTSDEGAYATQAQALDDGSWAYEYRAAPLDPTGTNFPIIKSAQTGRSFFTYVSHPAYPVLLAAGQRLAGRVLGLHILPLLGAMAAAVAAWLLAAEIDPGSSRAAFWLVAASPAVANGYLLWAHSISAALAGVALAAAVRIVRRGPTPLMVGGLAAALAAGALLRSEALLLALVVTAVVAASRLRRGGIVAGVTIGAALAAPTALAVLIERRWTASIVGVGSRNLDLRGETSSYLSDRIAGARHELFNGHYETTRAALPVLLILGLVVVLGFVALRRPRPESNRVLGLVAVAAVGLVGVRMALYPTEAVTGLFAAWPMALLGVVLLRRRDRQRSGVGLLLAVVAGFMAAVVLTQYPEGGGAEWGGRFFSPIVVALAVLAVTGFRHRLADLPPLDRRWAAGCLSVVAVATAVLGLVTVGQGRARHERFIAAVTRHPAEVTVTTVQALPRIAWRTDQELTWMVTGSGLAPLLDRLDGQGLDRMAVVTDHGAPSSTWPDGWKATEVDEPSLRGAGLGLFLLER
jgi:hypothetical protein